MPKAESGGQNHLIGCDMKKSVFYLFVAFSLFLCDLSAQNMDVSFTGSCGSYFGFNSKQTVSQSFTAGRT
jgi:hypothetical protein